MQSNSNMALVVDHSKHILVVAPEMDDNVRGLFGQFVEFRHPSEVLLPDNYPKGMHHTCIMRREMSDSDRGRIEQICREKYGHPNVYIIPTMGMLRERLRTLTGPARSQLQSPGTGNGNDFRGNGNGHQPENPAPGPTAASGNPNPDAGNPDPAPNPNPPKTARELLERYGGLNEDPVMTQARRISEFGRTTYGVGISPSAIAQQIYQARSTGSKFVPPSKPAKAPTPFVPTHLNLTQRVNTLRESVRAQAKASSDQFASILQCLDTLHRDTQTLEQENLRLQEERERARQERAAIAADRRLLDNVRRALGN